MLKKKFQGPSLVNTLVDPLHLYIQESVFPSLPPIFQDSISMIPLQEPFTGTCAKAICDGTSIISNDILADPGFDPKWRDLCLRCGVKSLQSAPFYADGKPQGTFVLGFKHETHDSNWNNALIGEFADLASQALRLYRTLSVSSAGN